VTRRLIFTGPRGGHVWRSSLNEKVWKRALAGAGVIPVPKHGQPYAESRKNGMHALRHFYASVLLDAGENVKALAEYLGHSDPRTDAPRVRAPHAVQPGAYAESNCEHLREEQCARRLESRKA
jgi:integrase